jgi:hypothetical protein
MLKSKKGYLYVREVIRDEQFEEQLNEVEKLHGKHSKMLRAFWEITRQKTIVK